MVSGGRSDDGFRSSNDLSGVSVFYKNAESRIFHTYSCYTRGLDMLITAYHYLDLLPKGRDKAELRFPIAWIRHHDRYEGDQP